MNTRDNSFTNETEDAARRTGVRGPARVCVCADDFGLHPAVNAAVLALVALGRLQATSAMVGAPAWSSGATALQRLDPVQLDVGLHLDLTEFPLTLPARGLGWWLLNAPRKVEALRREVNAQLDAFEQAMGRAPAYVDGHQHVHQFAGVRDALLAALTTRYPTHRPWLRSTRRANDSGFKPRVIEALGRRGLEREATSLDFNLNQRLLGVYDFQGDAQAYRERLLGWLDEAGDGDLLMCHPAMEHVTGDAIAAARLHEYAVWSDPALDSILRDRQVDLAPMSATLKSLRT